jgi:hypothetical protein
MGSCSSGHTSSAICLENECNSQNKRMAPELISVSKKTLKGDQECNDLANKSPSHVKNKSVSKKRHDSSKILPISTDEIQGFESYISSVRGIKTLSGRLQSFTIEESRTKVVRRQSKIRPTVATRPHDHNIFHVYGRSDVATGKDQGSHSVDRSFVSLKSSAVSALDSFLVRPGRDGEKRSSNNNVASSNDDSANSSWRFYRDFGHLVAPLSKNSWINFSDDNSDGNDCDEWDLIAMEISGNVHDTMISHNDECIYY